MYFPDPFLSFLTKCASSASDSQLKQYLDPFYLFFIFFEDFKVASLFDGFSFSPLISYAVRIPCNSSIVNLSRSFISSIDETLASNIKGIYLNTLCTIIIYLTISPIPMMVLKISSTRRIYAATFSSSFIFRLSNCLL